jgi:glycosyltransferase involved in cell wall biosynthesis
MSSNEKTLIILTPGFAKDESDSTCIPMQQSFVRTLKKNHLQLNIVILAFDYPYSKGIYRWFGNTVISFNGQNKGGLSRLLVRRRVAAALEKILSGNNIIGLLSFWYGECAFAGKKFAGKHGIKHYCWMWGQDVKKGNKYVKQVHLKANELVAFSDFLQDEFKKNHGILPQYVIAPGIDIKNLPPADIEKDIDIMGAGSLISLKQYDIFIEVIAEIKKKFPSVKAALIGDGSEKKRLQALIATLGVESNIILTGNLAHPELLKWMQRGKIFLHPSSYEGFGVVCIEALYAGARVISFAKPMNKVITNWYHVNTKEEMIQKTIELLKTGPFVYERPDAFPIEGTVKKIMELFS